jgi:hypothetical protein
MNGWRKDTIGSLINAELTLNFKINPLPFPSVQNGEGGLRPGDAQ